MPTYIYPKFPARYITPFFRIGGNGLANCLFVYGKAIVSAANHNDAVIIAPTWNNISIGTYLRKEKDKRHYFNLFNHNGEVCGIKKLFLLLLSYFGRKKYISVEKGIYDFFNPLIEKQSLVSSYILNHINQASLKMVNSYNFDKCIALHIRLGDFSTERKIPISWYIKKIKEINFEYESILLFSDGSDNELIDILSLPKVKRIYFGNAIADMVAISKCKYLIGSDSSFSAWGAFLGQVPCVFYRLQFGQVLVNYSNQIIENN